MTDVVTHHSESPTQTLNPADTQETPTGTSTPALTETRDIEGGDGDEETPSEDLDGFGFVVALVALLAGALAVRGRGD